LPTPVDRTELRRLVRNERAQLVEVLPQEDFDDEHLPAAVNIPLQTIDRTVALDTRRPVIVYCYDTR
jgi:rhodanese-related sulfurtransferase